MQSIPRPTSGMPFAIQDCALAAIATGKRAQNLRELRDNLRTIHPDSIYYHFWGGLLRPRFDDPEYHNDFAIWSLYALQDAMLAERLGIIDPTDYTDLEGLREEVVEVVEERLDQLEWVPWSKPDKQFYFVRSQIIVFDTHSRIERPEELAQAVPLMSIGSIFVHFVDARRRSAGGLDDFRAWIEGCFDGYKDLCNSLAKLDHFFSGLSELRKELTKVFNSYFGK
ncbi:MAG: hypothetical protein JSV01_10255 [Desulfobacterales bacterium]|nr:MAG: hypothetical protein JSV01_10255 [Desulfobacterales bacterium]